MIGRTLSHYKVLEKIGEGGMGEVYLAKDTKLDRDVAVKVLPANFSENKERLTRFEREARLLASLNHPKIAAIHELVESEGVHFLALKLRDIGEARIILDRDLDASSDSGNALSFERKRVAWAMWALFGAMVTVVGFLPWILTRENPGPGPTAHVLIETPSEGLWGGPPAPTVAISPDGSHIVLVGSRFYLRSIDAMEARPIPGTQDGAYPFFSLDSQWIGFFVDGKLQKISTRGGPPQVLCEVPQCAGGSWGLDDTIVFTPTYTSGLYRISATGGDPESVTAPNEREIGHLFPRFLPGEKEVQLTRRF